MALEDKYINPLLTGFGFKKLFGSELVAEIAKFSKEEKQQYKESLKYYRDIKNVVDTARQEGILDVAKKLKFEGAEIDLIQKVTGLSKEAIEKL